MSSERILKTTRKRSQANTYNGKLSYAEVGNQQEATDACNCSSVGTCEIEIGMMDHKSRECGSNEKKSRSYTDTQQFPKH